MVSLAKSFSPRATDFLSVTRGARGASSDSRKAAQLLHLGLAEAVAAQAAHGVGERLTDGLVAAVPLEGVRAGDAAGEQRGLEDLALDAPGQAVGPAVRVAALARHAAALRDADVVALAEQAAAGQLVGAEAALGQLVGDRDLGALRVGGVDDEELAAEGAEDHHLAVVGQRGAGRAALTRLGQGALEGQVDRRLRGVAHDGHRVGAVAEEVEAVARVVVGHGARLVEGEAGGGEPRLALLAADEGEAVDDWRAEAAAVAAGVLRALVLVRGRDLVRDDRQPVADERDGEGGARRALARVVLRVAARDDVRVHGAGHHLLGGAEAEAAVLRPDVLVEGDVLEARGLVTLERAASHRAGGQEGDRDLVAAARNGDAARLAGQRHLPQDLAGLGAVGGEHAIGDRGDQELGAIGAERHAVGVGGSVDLADGAQALAGQRDDLDLVGAPVHHVGERAAAVDRQLRGFGADVDAGQRLALAVGADQLAAVRIDHDGAVSQRRDGRAGERGLDGHVPGRARLADRAGQHGELLGRHEAARLIHT